MTDEARLLELASAIAEGSDIDWEQLERQSPDPEERSVIRELRVLASIAAVASQPDPAATAAREGEGGRAPAGYGGSAWGPLQLEARIGAGSFGEVYRAWDAQLARHVALKLLPEERFAGGRALKEAQQLARVRHQNVVTVFGADRHSGHVGLWMELVNGRTLEAIVTEHGPLAAREAAGIGIDLCNALAAVHQAGLLHRDIKARNVMREAGGRIVLMDFGSSLRIDSGEAAISLAGTPLYLAPELFERQPGSALADVYSVGVLLFYLVTGRHPVSGRTQDEVERAHRRGQRESLRDLRPDLPSSFVDVVERALSVDPSRRFESAGRFGAALSSVFVVQEAAVAPRPSRRNALVAAAAVGLVALGSIGYFGFVRQPAVAGPIAATASGVLPSPALNDSYSVQAAFYAVCNGAHVPLSGGERVVPGDQIYARLKTSAPVFAYVINQDERGQSYLLFPLRALGATGAAITEREIQMPGTRDGKEVYWQVTSAGGRERFLLYVSPTRLTEFEQATAAMPQPEFGRLVDATPLPSGAVGLLRGIGGLTTQESGAAAGPQTADLHLTPLSSEAEVTRGLWARQITFDNPAP